MKKIRRRGLDEMRKRLIERIDKLKDGRLPRNYKQRLVAQNPEYDSLQGAELIRNLMGKRSLDIVLIEKLEAIADEYEQESKTTTDANND